MGFFKDAKLSVSFLKYIMCTSHLAWSVLLIVIDSVQSVILRSIRVVAAVAFSYRNSNDVCHIA